MPGSMKDIEALIGEEGITDEVTLLLYNLKVIDLAILKATGSDKLKKQLDGPELQPFWTNKFNKLRLEKDVAFQFRNPEPQSRADFYCGYVLYLAALKENKKPNTNKYNDYLILSLSLFNCFYAVQEVLTSLIINCKNNLKIDNVNALYEFMTRIDSQTQQHKTPGCLLLANAYFYLAGFYQRLNFKRESAECYKLCWEKLHLAQLLEPTSEREIHNAYFGQGLVMSNAFRLDSIFEIKGRCRQLNSELFTDAVQHTAEAKAEKTFNSEFKSTMDTDTEDTLTRNTILRC
ncbi:Ankyrin repeat protein [Legionella santicrucis]|uniref:Ankyrin repeat protein n=1 Tax=Legionella santicrucis TaxID=45074 RepID=A0A0W0YFE3_9GAMM|nr:Dot/Icm T4SS effector metaeffector MesI [Legionella santicrucis]KTD55552.1 Ankyrin repeat protein [Legionella santicrucis]